MVAPSSPQPQVAHMVSSLPSTGFAGPVRPSLRHRHCRTGTTGSSRAVRSPCRSSGSAPRRAARRDRGRAPSATVPSVANSKQNCIASGTTAHSAPTSTLTLCTRRPAACSHTASTTLCVIAISCTCAPRWAGSPHDRPGIVGMASSRRIALARATACQLESNRCSSTVGSVRRLDAGRADLSVAASSVTAN